MTAPSKKRPSRRQRKTGDLTQKTFRDAAAFERLQGAYIEAGLRQPGVSRWPAALMLFEAICDLEDLKGIQANGVTYQDGSATRLDWARPDGRRDARHLSAISVLALHADGTGPRANGRLIEVIEAWFEEAASPSVLRNRTPAGAALSCSSAWLRLKLPPELFEHVMGITPMTPLDRATAARLATGMTLQPKPGSEPPKPTSVLALDAYFNTQGDDSSRSVLQAVVDAASLKGSSRLKDHDLLQRMAGRWTRLIHEAEAAGPVTSLLVGHVIDLAERGALVPRSLVPYVRYGAPAVIEALAGHELELMTSDQLGATIVAAFSRLALTGEALRKARAFFGLFIAYARQWLHVAPVPSSALPDIEDATVDANVVTPQEVTRISDWLTRDTSDVRLSEQTRLVLLLLQHLEVRVSEVFFLQVRNLRVSNAVIELEVAGQGRLHGLKSPQAQQSRVIHDVHLAACITRWKLRRSGEGALDADLLFGSKKAQRRVYRLAAMYAWLNGALKRVTGLRDACCHWLRHAAIDRRYVRISLGLAPGDSLDQLSIDSSHLEFRTTHLNYLHSYPIALRAVLDSKLQQRRIPSSWAAKWTGATASKLRQDYCRLKQRDGAVGALPPATCYAYNWQAIRTTASRMTCEAAKVGVALCEPLPLPELGRPRAPTAADVIGLLLDWQRGVDPNEAGKQWQFDDQAVMAVLKRLTELGTAEAKLHRYRIRARLTTPKAALEALRIRVSKAFQPKYEAWLRSLDHPGTPTLTPDAWIDWAHARRGNYISLGAHLRSDRWLSYLLATGLSPSKLVICSIEDNDAIECQALRDVELAIANSLGAHAVNPPRAYEVNSRKGRPGSYLLVADESDELTNQTGAAFSPGGLTAVMLALHLYTVAKEAVEAAPV